jgi:CheY-like chemotaxis protein
MMDKVNILLVDDQPAKLLSYEVILEELGERLIKVGSAREALEQLPAKRNRRGAHRRFHA